MERPNYYSGILKVSTGILKGNVYLVRNTCNLPEIFCKDFLLIFLTGASLFCKIMRIEAQNNIHINLGKY